MAALVGAAAVVVVVVRIAPSTPRHASAHATTTSPTTPSVPGFPASLSHVVIVAERAPSLSGGSPYAAIAGGTGRSIPIGEIVTSDSLVPPTGAALVGGGMVVVDLPLQPGTDDIGTAVALVPGRTTKRALGPASYVFAGPQRGSVWIQAGKVDSVCSLREVTVTGATLYPSRRIPCGWTVEGVDGPRLVVYDNPGGTYVATLDLWDPSTNRLTDLSTSLFADPGHSVAGGVLASPAGGAPCTVTCRFATGELARGAFHTVTLDAAPGMYFPFSLSSAFALSPDGRFIAMLEIPPAAYARQRERAIEPGLGCILRCASIVRGVLAIYDATTGATVADRNMDFFDDGSPVWSPHGRYVLVGASDDAIAAVPALSPSAPVTSYRLTTTAGHELPVVAFTVAALP